jgi:hypothetical protein
MKRVHSQKSLDHAALKLPTLDSILGFVAARPTRPNGVS